MSWGARTEGDVLGRDAGVVEGVERHLGGGLADGLRADRPNHLAGMDGGLKGAQSEVIRAIWCAGSILYHKPR